MALDLHLTSDQGYENLLPTLFNDTTAPFDLLVDRFSPRSRSSHGWDHGGDPNLPGPWFG